MVILKVLNNNLALSRDDSGREVIVKGKGIAFQKRKGEEIASDRIEKIFVADSPQKRKQMEAYFTAIPEEYFDFVGQFMERIKETGELKFNASIYFTLSDHIHGTFQRLDKGIQIKNMLLMDIRQLYRREYELGREMLKELESRFDRKLPPDEAGFIALHLINAQSDNGSNIEEISHIVQKILNVVAQYYQPIVFHEDDMYYQRFVTHLKYFAQRYLHKELQYSEDTSLYDIIRAEYKEAYGCAKLVYLMMEEDYGYQMTEEEMLYMIIHIQKVTEDHRNYTK